MTTQPSPELVQKQVERIFASPIFARTDRLRRFLAFAVKRTLEGHSHCLKEYTIGLEVFDRDPSYDQRTDPIVRVQARVLRSKLEEYYSTDGADDDVLIELPKGSYVPAFSLRGNAMRRETEGAPHRGWLHRFRNASLPSRSATLGGIAVAVLVSVALLSNGWQGGREVRRSVTAPRQLTFDAGFTSEPALSPDASLVAYSTDRSGEEFMDIWLQQAGSQESMQRLTSGPGSSREPSFSPDGTQIVFRREGPVAGVYLVPALGGQPRLLAREGREPRFSPDGRWVVYWTGERHQYRLKDRRVFVVPVEGGIAREIVTPLLSAASFANWLPDSKHLLVYACSSDTGKPDWYVVPLSGGDAVQTGVPGRVFSVEGLSTEFGESASNLVLASGRLVFAARKGDSVNLFSAAFSPDSRRPTKAAERITFGSGTEVSPAAAGNHIAFVNMTRRSSIWSLPVDANRGVVRGGLKQVVGGVVRSWAPSGSRDGQLMAYLAERNGVSSVWICERKAGAERRLPYSAGAMSPRLSHNGHLIAFRGITNGNPATQVSSVQTGETLAVSSVLGTPLDWSEDDQHLLLSEKGEVVLWDIHGGRHDVILSNAEARGNLHWASFSPDYHWIAFHCLESERRTVYVAPFRHSTSVARSDWRVVSPLGDSGACPRWSPDGRLLYYLSDRDGFLCIWAQRLDQRRSPEGQPFAVHHFHGARLSLANLENPGSSGFTVHRDEVLLALGERRGNIWMLDLPE